MKQSTLSQRQGWHSKSGSILPVLMITSAILLISGMAILTIGPSMVKGNAAATSHTQAFYIAEEAARKAIWRIKQTPPFQWTYWATFTESNASSVFDSLTNILTVTGQYQNVSDTIQVTLDRRPSP